MRATDWYEITDRYNNRTLAHGWRLSSLPNEWQRELAAIGRLEGDVNNGGYLQFLCNWGVETYRYAHQALRKIGAHSMAGIVERCHAIVEEYVDLERCTPEDLSRLMPNRVIGPEGNTVKEAGSTLPEEAIRAIHELSYEFMEYPEDITALGLKYYRGYIEED